jgi:hypothetical protein
MKPVDDVDYTLAAMREATLSKFDLFAWWKKW